VDKADQIIIQGSRNYLIPFTRLTKEDYKPAPFHYKIAKALEDCANGKINRLMIFMPPRHGKSELASIRFPAWLMGRQPDFNIIMCSHTVELARKFSRKVKELINDNHNYRQVFGTTIKADSRAAHRWETNKGGAMLAAGAEGPITGHGANGLIIDDPFKGLEDAASPVIQEKRWDWYRAVALTRLQKNIETKRPGFVIIIMTRWNQLDLAGRILAQEADQWKVISFPAIGPNQEPLWPEMFSLQEYEAIRERSGPYNWNALYQQEPTPLEGNIFKSDWLQFYNGVRPEFKKIIQSWDTAFKAGAENDYSACTTWGDTGGEYWLLDVYRDRLEYPALKKKAIELYSRYNPAAVLIEDKASGQSLIQDLRAMPIPIKPVKADTDKISRANSVSGLVEAGRVKLPEVSGWSADFINEVISFPNGTHDDQVDSMVHALVYMKRQPWHRLPIEKFNMNVMPAISEM
jgi:predicted phage terminase large subunit-like protein